MTAADAPQAWPPRDGQARLTRQLHAGGDRRSPDRGRRSPSATGHRGGPVSFGLRLGRRNDRRLPPALGIPPGYTCGIGVTTLLLAVHIRHKLRYAVLR